MRSRLFRHQSSNLPRCLAHYRKNKTHENHLHFDECKKIGLNVQAIEEVQDSTGQKDPVFQDLILTVHHCYMHLMMNTSCMKAIENQSGIGLFKHIPAAVRSEE